ncbi:MAG TPA: M28 family metallopeptidase [Woeseiaceae bacterium]|nr:M28 family metallopeptidase [Woeseiaceae bacterium]
MRLNTLPCLMVLLACTLAACSRNGDDTGSDGVRSVGDLDAALATVKLDTLKGHLDFLASDVRQGRMTGTAAYDDAAAYVADQFAALGLEPAGEDGWFQNVPLTANRLDTGRAAVTLHKDDGDSALTWKDEFVMSGDDLRAESSITADVVFVGFGVHAPDMDYSDYDGIDVSGKIVALFSGAPANFPHNERAFYSSGRTKAEEMVRRGAVGYIGLRSRVDQKRVPWERLTLNAGVQPGMSWINLSGNVADYHAEIQGNATINVPTAAELFDGTPITFEEALDAADAGRPRSTALGVKVTLTQHTSHEEATSANVVGLLRGSDPLLASEYIVYSAHLDHVGVGTAVNGDDIYNGYYDNAMGVALMIEAARAFAAMPVRPERSILFVAVTGEERGLLGSDYFAHYPTVPTESIIANVNLDMPLFLYPLADIIAFGAEHSTLESQIAPAIAVEQFVLTPDPIPEEVIFIRSDQYSFVRQGIPAVYLVPGFTSQDPAIDGEAAFREHLATHYHRPSDDATRPVDWESALRFARANVRIGLQISSTVERPRWNEGDFFGTRFARPNP